MIDRITELCIKKGINGKQLGELLGLKKSPLTDWKNKKAKPTVDQIIMMCEIFATSTEYILLGKECQELEPEEQALLAAYRRSDERGKRNIMKEALYEAEQGKSSTSGNGREVG